MRRGEVRVLVSRVSGRERAVLIVGNDALNESETMSLVLTARIDTEHIGTESLVTVRITEPVNGVVHLEDVSAVRKERVRDLVGHVTPDAMEQVNIALRAALDL